MEYRSVDFVQHSTDNCLLVVSGSDNYKGNLRIVNTSDKNETNFYLEDTKLTQVSFIKTNKSKVTGIVTGTDKGNLLIFAYPFYDRILDQISAHQGEVTKIIISPDNRFLFSAGSDGTLFIYQIGEQNMILENMMMSAGGVKNNQLMQQMLDDNMSSQQQLDDMVNSIVDEALADIVLVKKDEMEKWQRKQDKLKHDLNVNKKLVEQKIAQSKAKYEK